MPDLLVEPGPLTVVRFNRPDKKNAITTEMYVALAAALLAADADPDVLVVLITGSGGAFTAGNDLYDFLKHPPTGEGSPVFDVLTALATFSKPLVAAVDGVAIGVGTTLLLHCDLVYASDRSRFAMPFVNLGLTPEGASSVLLAPLVGFPKAAEWLYFGEPFFAAEALAAGLINSVHPVADLESVALARCQSLCAKPVQALRAAKALLRGPQRAMVRDALAREGQEFVTRLSSPEAIAAFTRFLSR